MNRELEKELFEAAKLYAKAVAMSQVEGHWNSQEAKELAARLSLFSINDVAVAFVCGAHHALRYNVGKYKKSLRNDCNRQKEQLAVLNELLIVYSGRTIDNIAHNLQAIIKWHEANDPKPLDPPLSPHPSIKT